METQIFSTYYPSPVGLLTIASDGAHVVGLWIEGQKYYGGGAADRMIRNDDLPVFASARDWLDRYFSGGRPLPGELPLSPAGGEFRQRVWRLLCGIPYGKTMTYGAIARTVAAELGRSSMSAQAVGGAVGHNPISIIIPCHRVLGSDGSLTGYAGGTEVKRYLLKMEGAEPSLRPGRQ